MFFLYLLGTYIIGSIPFGLMISFLGYDVDIRQTGSGNIGMTNVQRSVGPNAAILTLLGDVGKGWMMVTFSPEKDANSLMWVGIAVLLGHCYSVFLQGKGGKRCCNSTGSHAVFSWSCTVSLICLGVTWIGIKMAFKSPMSLASLVAMGALLAQYTNHCLTVSMTRYTFLFTAAFVTWRHKDNIESWFTTGWRITIVA